MNLVPLENLVEINPRLPSDIDDSQKVSFVSMSSVTEAGDLVNTISKTLSETRKGFTYFKRGDVLLAKITPCFENGKAAYTGALIHEVGFGSTEFHVLRPKSKWVDAKYIFYMIWNEKFRYYAEKAMKGAAGQKRVSADFIKKYEVPLPFESDPEKSLAEQNRIVAILEKADSISRKSLKAIDFADKFISDTFLAMFGDLYINPKGWSADKFDNLTSECLIGLVRNSKEFGVGYKYPYVRMDAIGKHGHFLNQLIQSTNATVEEADTYQLSKGDLLFNTRNSKELVGKTALFNLDTKEVLFNNNIMRVRFNEKVLPEFIFYYFQSKAGKRALDKIKSGTTNVFAIYHSSLKEVKIPVPQVHLQRKFTGIAQQVEVFKLKMQKCFDHSHELYLSLSQKAFKGEL